MDSIDRIAPITPINPNVNLRVAESNKDGKQKPGGDQPTREEPHDVLELHSEEGEEVVIHLEDSTEPPTFGLDLAV